MAMKRFPCEQYASIELNQVAFPKTGMVVSQVPLGAAFTKDAPCENGMWLVGDKAAKAINAPAAATDKPIGIVYTTEKEYNDIRTWGLKTFGRKIAGDYPRLGLLGVGDTITTNCLQYDDTVFPEVTTSGSKKTSDEVLDAYLSALDNTNKAYVIISSKTGAKAGVPEIVKTLPNGYVGVYGRIVKYYTVPNGEKGVKYQIISL